MNSNKIISSYISKPRQLKKNANGVMTPIYLPIYDKKYNYTERFKQYNKVLLKQGLTDVIVYDENLIYNRDNDTFEKRSKYFKKYKRALGTPRLKKALPRGRIISDNVFQLNPVIKQLNREGRLYTYSNSFQNRDTIVGMKFIFKSYAGRRILIKAIAPGVYNWEKEQVIDIPLASEFNRWWKDEAPFMWFMVDSPKTFKKLYRIKN